VNLAPAARAEATVQITLASLQLADQETIASFAKIGPKRHDFRGFDPKIRPYFLASGRNRAI
jgi:hypothetical protein